MKTKEAVCKRIILSIFSLLVLCRTAGAQDSQKATLTAADGGTCSATSTACLVINIPSGSGGATFNIGANASANTVQFEASADYGATWVALSVTPSSSTTTVTSTTSTGAWQANVAGYTKARMRCSTFVGGTTTTYINLSTASARAGGGGSVTHTAGNLTAFHLMLGNGLADSTVDSACLTNGTGALSGCTSLSAGSGASAAGATATGGFAAVEAASTGWTPTVGQDYMRADSTLHTFVCALNGVAEVPCASSALSGLTAAAASNTIANGNNPQTWNCALTTDALDCIAFGETSAATNGTLTNGLANQAVHSVSTLPNSTATPFEVVQGSITNTVATPAVQIETTWNNAGLVGEGLLLNVTNTASSNSSLIADLRVNNTNMFGIGNDGLGVFNGTGTVTSSPLHGVSAGSGWKFCLYSTTNCTGRAAATEVHTIDGWISFSLNNPNSNANATTPDTGVGLSFFSANFAMIGKELAGCGLTNISGEAFLCLDGTSHEALLATNGSTSTGMLTRVQPAPIHQTAKTAAITTATLCPASAGACNIAGNYTIEWAFTQVGTACGTPGAGGVTFLLTWTDQNGVTHSAIQMPMDDAASLVATTGTFHFTTSNATAWGSGNMNISSNGSIIQYATGYTACGVGTGSYQLDAFVTRKQ